MFCRQLPRVVRRDLSFAARCFEFRATPRSFVEINHRRLRIRPYSTRGKTIDDDALQKLDVDAIEAHLKKRFGDPTTWSHDDLLKFMICKFDHARCIAFTNIRS
jgi:hypothetical protein